MPECSGNVYSNSTSFGGVVAMQAAPDHQHSYHTNVFDPTEGSCISTIIGKGSRSRQQVEQNKYFICNNIQLQ